MGRKKIFFRYSSLSRFLKKGATLTTSPHPIISLLLDTCAITRPIFTFQTTVTPIATFNNDPRVISPLPARHG